jgi:hypothetical protein
MHRLLLPKKALDAVNEALLTPSDYPGADPDYANPWFFKGTEPEEIKTANWGATLAENLKVGDIIIGRDRQKGTITSIEPSGQGRFVWITLANGLRTRYSVREGVNIERAPKFSRRGSSRIAEETPAPKRQETLTDRKNKNMESWQKKDPDFKRCPKCKGYGVSITKQKRDHSQCSQCTGTGWKFSPKKQAEVELHESPTKLPPRNELRTRMDADLQEEIDENKPEYKRISRLLQPKN